MAYNGGIDTVVRIDKELVKFLRVCATLRSGENVVLLAKEGGFEDPSSEIVAVRLGVFVDFIREQWACWNGGYHKVVNLSECRSGHQCWDFEVWLLSEETCLANYGKVLKFLEHVDPAGVMGERRGRSVGSAQI